MESRRPTQNVCNINEANDDQCLEIDVRACRLNGLVEANCEDVPIFSPLDEIVKARQGQLYDYQWIDIGGIRCPLKKYIFDGPRWYSKSETKYMLETGICQWRHIKLGLEATAHRAASDLATVLKTNQKQFGSKLANLYMLNGFWARKSKRNQKVIFSPRQLC